ncbi:hypothetical protein [Roseateles sp.]|uniref:hypothetical protein n=1 Tax=Roseateles sp. TaxID=1971397 RepID=UPI0025F3C501|nr:hypothetical protein [Roseateles sp.]MBV8035184.1 hypothetical protein [Roseateles sp.]
MKKIYRNAGCIGTGLEGLPPKHQLAGLPGGHPNSPTDGHPKFPHPGAVAMTS